MSTYNSRNFNTCYQVVLRYDSAITMCEDLSHFMENTAKMACNNPHEIFCLLENTVQKIKLSRREYIESQIVLADDIYKKDLEALL